MTPLARWLRNLREKYLGTFYEGPEMPDRLANMVTVFAQMNPLATRGEWIEFAQEHAREVYRSGYVRGVEYAERDEHPGRGDWTPEQYADAVDPDWRWGDAVKLEWNPLDIVPEAYADEEVLRHALDQVARRR